MNKKTSRCSVFLLAVASSIILVGCTSETTYNNTTPMSISESELNQNYVSEQEIINQKLKTIPQEDQINVLEDKIIPKQNIKQKVIEIYIPNYEEDYLIAKTISLEVEEGSRSDYVDNNKVMNFLREKEIIPSNLPTISIAKQFNNNISCLNVDFPEEVYSLFNNYEDEKLFLEATLKTLLNIYDTQEISISVNYGTYNSNFILIDEFKYYR